jgi:dienelactone hydrolase
MFKETLHIPVLNQVTLFGDIVIPDHAQGIVIFAHGSGSSRFSPRNKHVALALQQQGMATLLVDLLTIEEDKDYDNRFEIALLTERLIEVTKWIMSVEITRGMSIGYFGASTGAACALSAAARLGDHISCVVSRGGRPDLAREDLPKVKCPVLLLVGGLDLPVIQMNRSAYLDLDCPKELIIVQGASHLFEEPGKLEEVANLAADWFTKHLMQKISNPTHHA